MAKSASLFPDDVPELHRYKETKRRVMEAEEKKKREENERRAERGEKPRIFAYRSKGDMGPRAGADSAISERRCMDEGEEWVETVVDVASSLRRRGKVTLMQRGGAGGRKGGWVLWCWDGALD